ncbi:MAG: DUF6029 family protein [Chitinophagaceae bacterium]
MKKIIIPFLVFVVTNSKAQEVKTKGSFLGSVESNSQLYLKDAYRNITEPEDPFRSNTYLQIQYNYKKWTAGVQGEAYLPKAILNFNPKFKGVGLGTAYINYKSKKLDITAGHFYEQFGSGLLLRSWEDRSLGINNALMGGRIKYTPVSSVRITALGGKQRTGFSLSEGVVFGMDAEFDLLSLNEKQQAELTLGLNYIGRHEKIKISNPNFNTITNGFSGRLNYTKNFFSSSIEYDYKSEDAILYDKEHISNDFVKSGNAILVNLGYAKKGVGTNISLRRLENMSFYSEREPEIIDGNRSTTFNDKMVNYIPSLTRQHHFGLANIYVYQAQQIVDLEPSSGIGKAGEVGGMIDFFYVFKKGSKLGGKNGTKAEFSFSNYNSLSGNYILYPPAYETNLPGIGQKLFSDFSFEISKKIKSKWHGSIAFINQYFNNRWITGAANVRVKTNILATEWEYQISKKTSLKWSAEHLWSKNDRGNWLSGMFEVNFSSHLSFFASDMYNYGYDKDNNLIDHFTDPFDIHFYNFGSSYKTGTFRVSANYGRQRGGLVCTGGICRFVVPSTGLGLSVTKSF